MLVSSGEFVLLAIPPIILFLMSASVLPRSLSADGRIDMRAEWVGGRRVFLTLFAAYQSVAWVFLTAARGRVVFDFAGLARTVILALVLLTLVWKSRRVEWFAVMTILAVTAVRLFTQSVR